MKKSIVVQGVFLVMCSISVAQTPDWAPASSEPPGILQQTADITVFGDSGVVVVRLGKEGVATQRFVLAGPNVRLIGSLGEVFSVGDLNSPGVAGVLEGDTAVFLGDLELIAAPMNPDASQSAYWRVTAYNALVEIRTTESVSNSYFQKPSVSSGEIPLNQRAEHIRAVLEEVRESRNQ